MPSFAHIEPTDPAAATLMRDAFKAACDVLVVLDGPEADRAREAMAFCIINAVQKGERDLVRLRDLAVNAAEDVPRFIPDASATKPQDTFS